MFQNLPKQMQKTTQFIFLGGNSPKPLDKGGCPPPPYESPCSIQCNVTMHGANNKNNITQNAAETRPLNKNDNQAPQPTISHLETDHNNSNTTGICSIFGLGKFLIFAIILEG
jgi:hypothetical protein